MADVVREILWCLLFAGLLGGVIGWALRGLRHRRSATGAALASQRGMEELRSQLSASQLAGASQQRAFDELQAVAARVRLEAETLRRQLTETEMARDTARHDTAGTRDHLSKLVAQLQELTTARDTARAELEVSRVALASARSRTAEVEGQRDAFRRENEALQASRASSSVDDARNQKLETLRATLQAAENGWDTARAQAEAGLEQLAATRRQLAQSEVDRNALSAQLVEAEAKLEALRTEHAPTLLPEDLSVPATQASAPARAKARSKVARDDLQQIRGIGPVLERTLHRAGIYRYAQIAQWTREDVLSFSKRLPGIPDRIVRDRWQAAARRLHIAKYGSPL